MNALNMPRKRAAFRIDERILEAMDSIALSSQRSRNSWLESHLFELFKSTGHLPTNAQPLGSNKGGDFVSAKAKAARAKAKEETESDQTTQKQKGQTDDPP